MEVRSREVWDEARKRTRGSLENGNTLVFDAVFNDADKRKEFLDFVKENGAEKIQGIYIDAPIDVAKKRNSERERKVPEQIIDNIAADLKEAKPKIEEGLDSIFTIDEYQNLIAAEIRSPEGNIRKGFR